MPSTSSTQWAGRTPEDKASVEGSDADGPAMDFRIVLANMRPSPMNPLATAAKARATATGKPKNAVGRQGDLWADRDGDDLALARAKASKPIPPQKRKANAEIAGNKKKGPADYPRELQHCSLGLMKATYGAKQSYCQYVPDGTGQKHLFFSVHASQTTDHANVFVQVWRAACSRGLTKEATVALRAATLAIE